MCVATIHGYCPYSRLRNYLDSYLHNPNSMIHNYCYICIYMQILISGMEQHCKNKIVKITNLLVSTVARNNGDCNLIGRVGCYGYTIQ